MSIFSKRGYDRARLMEAAARARARRKRKKAIQLYRCVLAVERHNPELHGKLGPLLAETGHDFDAWVSFQTAAQACLREGLVDKALAVYREAATYLPREPQVWQAIAKLEQKRGRQRDAVEALLEGSCQFRSRWRWPEAIYLLRLARKLDPWDFETVLALARLLAKTHQRHESRLLLEALAAKSHGERLRRVRATQFRGDGSPRHAWLWTRAAFGLGARAERPERAASPVVPLRQRLVRR